MRLSSGSLLGSYEVVAPLGAGGMGEVYRARDTRLERDVALKVLPPEVAHDAERVGRFEREAKLLATLNHPNVAAIHGFEEVDGTAFLAMELVNGEDLARRIERGPIPVEEAIALAVQMTHGLQAAHDQGVVHRDLKPSNVMVTPDDEVKILDFGLARAMSSDPASAEALSESPTLTAATRAGVVLGTAPYMSPEQARGRQADQRSDIWSFGAVLFEMLSGCRFVARQPELRTWRDVDSARAKHDPDAPRRASFRMGVAGHRHFSGRTHPRLRGRGCGRQTPVRPPPRQLRHRSRSGQRVERTDRRLEAMRFDIETGRVVGAPVAVLSDVSMLGNSAGAFAFSDDGTLAYTTGPLSGSQHVLTVLALARWDGSLEQLPFDPDFFTSASMSPEGSRVAATTNFGGLVILDPKRRTRLALPVDVLPATARIRLPYPPTYRTSRQELALVVLCAISASNLDRRSA